jgi:hypothetical protein
VTKTNGMLGEEGVCLGANAGVVRTKDQKEIVQGCDIIRQSQKLANKKKLRRTHACISNSDSALLQPLLACSKASG